MANQNFSDKFKELKDLVNSKEPSVQKQKVMPIATKKIQKKINLEKDEPFTFWTSKEKMKRIKIRALQDDNSIKELINKALDLYLNT